MKILISEVRSALKLRLHMVSIIALFAIPDAAATVEYGFEKPGVRYPKWFDAFVEKDAGVDGQLAWLVRNALIHETAINWRAKGYDFERLVINVPTPHLPGGVHALRIIGNQGVAHVVELDRLATAILSGAEKWLHDALLDPERARKIDAMMQVRPDGIAPLYVGTSIIT